MVQGDQNQKNALKESGRVFPSEEFLVMPFAKK